MNAIVFYEKNRIKLSFKYDQGALDFVRGITGRQWNKSIKCWSFPSTYDTYKRLKEFFTFLPGDSDTTKWIDRIENGMSDIDVAHDIRREEIDEVTDYEFKTEPFKHQKVCFNFVRSLTEAALFLDMGTGKSKIIIDVICDKYKKGVIKNVLIIAPSSTLDNMKDEFRIHSTVDFKIAIIRGTKKQRIDLLNSDAQIFLINYEGLLSVKEELLSMHFGIIVADESSKLKRTISKRSKICHKLYHISDYRYIMTGTPITQSPMDVFSQYKFLNPNMFGNSFSNFQERYAVMGGFGGFVIVGYRNVEELKKKLYHIAIRYKKEDCLTLPDKIYQERIYELTHDQKKQYNSMCNDLIAEINNKKITVDLAMCKMIKLSELCSGFMKDDEGKIHYIDKSGKLELLEELIDEILPNKIVIWCRFTAEVEMIKKFLDEKKHLYSELHGGIPMEDRFANIKKFQEDDNVKFFIGQVQCGGIGINLTSGSYVIYFGHSYSLEDRLQSEDRCHRIGQKNNVTYIDLIGANTVERSVINILKKKKTVSDMVTNNSLDRILRGVYNI